MACPLCGAGASSSVLYAPSGGIRAAHLMECPTCGRFIATEEFCWNATRDAYALETRCRLSGITRNATERGEALVEVRTDNIDELLKSAPQPSYLEACDSVLRYLCEKSGPGREEVGVSPRYDWPLFYLHGERVLVEILADHFRSDFIKHGSLTTERPSPTLADGTTLYRPTMKAYERVEARLKDRRLAALPRVPQEVESLRTLVNEARNAADCQAIGHRSREAVLTIAQSVYDAEKHKHPDGKKIGSADAKGMLESYLAATLLGSGQAEARALVRAAEAFASAVAHDREGKRWEAALAVEAAAFLAVAVGIVEGQEG